MYADINGLRMYYEVHGTARAGTVPLVLLHGAMSATGTSFGPLPDLLAQSRQVIAIEQQGHGRTADIDRPLSMSAMVEDTMAMLTHLGIDEADVFGYSLGAGIAVHILLAAPKLIRRAVLASVVFDPSGLHPQLLEPPPAGSNGASAEDLRRRFEEEYRRLAPNPDDWPSLAKKLAAMRLPSLSNATIEAIDTPILLIVGDQRHGHARTRGGRVPAARRRNPRRPRTDAGCPAGNPARHLTHRHHRTRGHADDNDSAIPRRTVMIFAR